MLMLLKKRDYCRRFCESWGFSPKENVDFRTFL